MNNKCVSEILVYLLETMRHIHGEIQVLVISRKKKKILVLITIASQTVSSEITLNCYFQHSKTPRT